jgi:hypothetical protein
VGITSRMVLRSGNNVSGCGTLDYGATMAQVKIPNRRETEICIGILWKSSVLNSSILC